MSEIKKSERTESKLEVIHNAYAIRMAVTKIAENNFYINDSKIEKIIAEKIKLFPEADQKKLKKEHINILDSKLTELQMEFLIVHVV